MKKILLASIFLLSSCDQIPQPPPRPVLDVPANATQEQPTQPQAYHQPGMLEHMASAAVAGAAAGSAGAVANNMTNRFMDRRAEKKHERRMRSGGNRFMRARR